MDLDIKALLKRIPLHCLENSWDATLLNYIAHLESEIESLKKSIKQRVRHMNQADLLNYYDNYVARTFVIDLPNKVTNCDLQEIDCDHKYVVSFYFEGDTKIRLTILNKGNLDDNWAEIFKGQTLDKIKLVYKKPKFSLKTLLSFINPNKFQYDVWLRLVFRSGKYLEISNPKVPLADSCEAIELDKL